MKIAIITPDYFPHLGSASVVVHGFSRALLDKGFEVEIVVAEEDTTTKEYEVVEGLKIHRLHFPRFKTSRLTQFLFMFSCIRKLRELKPDVVYGEELLPPGLITAIYGKMYRAKSVVMGRGEDVTIVLRKTLLLRPLNYISLRFNDFVFGLSSYLVNMMKSYVDRKMYVVPRGASRLDLEYPEVAKMSKEELWRGIGRFTEV